ncbi:MAG: hypothetical protein LBH84_05045 [Prevotellaceae bacterium]|nr:hypothetical protein [Prevotellaceae bacterium]
MVFYIVAVCAIFAPASVATGQVEAFLANIAAEQKIIINDDCVIWAGTVILHTIAIRLQH